MQKEEKVAAQLSVVPDIEAPAGLSLLRQLSRELSRNKRLLLCSLALSIALSTSYFFIVGREYVASVMLRVPPPSQSADLNTFSNETQIQEIKSLSLADRVLEKDSDLGRFFQNRSNSWLESALNKTRTEAEQKGEYHFPSSVLQTYVNSLSVSVVANTSLVNLIVTSPVPQYAARQANLHAQEYVDWVRRSRYEQRSSGVKTIDSEVKNLSDVLSGIEHQAGAELGLNSSADIRRSWEMKLADARQKLEDAIQRRNQLDAAIQGDALNVAIVDPANIPDHLSYSGSILISAGLLLAGPVLALLWLISSMLFGARKVVPENLEEEFGTPVLGLVPSFAGRKRTVTIANSRDLPEESNPPIVFINEGWSAVSEAYRAIRTSVLLSKAGSAPRVILVTSARPSEGKTTTALNLAASFAAAGRRVVLVDADLRRPRASKTFALDPGQAGLSELLNGELLLEDVIQPTASRRLWMMGAGRIPENPSELLSSTNLEAVVTELSGDFDLVVIDSPPVLVVTDAVITSRAVDGVVLVARSSETPQQALRVAMRSLAMADAKLLGVVLNDVSTVDAGHYFGDPKGYADYYRYPEVLSKTA